MRKIDFQEAIHEYQPCKHFSTILKLMCDEHGMSRQDFIVLLEVHAYGEFTWGDFATAELTASWDKRRFYRWKEQGLIKLIRAKDGKFKRYNIYACTRKARNIVTDFYDYSSGKKDLPVLSYSTNHKYSSNRLVKKIIKLKENGPT